MTEIATIGREHEPIRGAVAALVNERELVINRGANHGVVRGMKFRVLTTNDVEVTDPETGKSLGRIVRIKVRVQATSVQEQMTICRTYERLRGGVGLRAIQEQLAEPIYRTLRADDEGFLPPIAEGDSYIKVGDPVEEIEE